LALHIDHTPMTHSLYHLTPKSHLMKINFTEVFFDVSCSRFGITYVIC